MRNETPERIDWEALAHRLVGLVKSKVARSESDLARAALAEIVGAEALRAAVDDILADAAGADLARSVLSQLRPWSAMQRCDELYRTEPELEARRGAIKLLRVVADRRALPWIPEYLADPDPKIQLYGGGVLYHCLYSGIIEAEECAPLMAIMATHPNPRIREQHEALERILAADESE